MRFIATIVLIFLLYGCGSSDSVDKRLTIEDSEHYTKDNPDISKSENILYTGWYFISDTSTGCKRQLNKSSVSYNIDPVPIVTAANIDKVSMFHEKDCYALLTWLDKKGAQALNTAKHKAKGKKLAFILDNKLLRIQPVDDPQFANVQDDADPRIYGEVLTFPCNSSSLEEMRGYETILKSEK